MYVYFFFACWIICVFLSFADFFLKIIFFDFFFSAIPSVSTFSIQTRPDNMSDLSPNCLQWLSADDRSLEEGKELSENMF